jgi:hypothetical protein
LAETRIEELVDSGLEYRPGEPVLVRVVRRGGRIELSDEGRGVALAGRPPGWRDAVERLVQEEYWLNLSRHGEIFVPVVRAGPGLGPLLARVADASRAVYQEILDLDWAYS